MTLPWVTFKYVQAETGSTTSATTSALTSSTGSARSTTSTAGRSTSHAPNRVHPRRDAHPGDQHQTLLPLLEVTERNQGPEARLVPQVRRRPGHPGRPYGPSPRHGHRVRLSGGAAWHFDDDDGLTKEKYKTSSQSRGYATVLVRSGGKNDHRTQTEHKSSSAAWTATASTRRRPKNVTVPDGEGGSYPDTDARQGFELKTTAYLQPGGAVTSKTINTVWTHETATRVRSWGTTTANLTGTAAPDADRPRRGASSDAGQEHLRRHRTPTRRTTRVTPPRER